MSSNIHWSARISSVLVQSDQILPNFYDLTLNFAVITDNKYEQKVAFDRIRAFVLEIVDNALIISEDHDLLELFEAGTNTRVLTLPDEPSDQLFCAALMEKINAITEGKLLILYAGIQSLQAQGLSYNFDSEDSDPRLDRTSISSDSKLPPWWKRSDITINDYQHELPDSQEAFIRGIDLTWQDLELAWTPPEDNANADTSAEVMEFRPRFRPTVVKNV